MATSPVRPTRRDASVDESEVARTAYAGGAPAAATFRDRIRWGPVVAGFLTAIVTLVVLTVLGLAIGLSAFDPGAAGIGTAATIWGILTAIAAFFVGGFVAARTAAPVEGAHGPLNGLMVGVTAIAVMLWMIGAGAGNILGAAGANLQEIVNLVNVGGLEVTQEQTQAAFDTARNSAWGTLIGLLVALGAATAGGAMGTRGGPNDRPERNRR